MDFFVNTAFKTFFQQPIPGDASVFTKFDHILYYGPTHRDYIQMDLVNFSLFILSYLIVSDFKCYNSLLGQCSFSYFFFSCHISFPGVPFLHLSSLSSYPGTPHIHCMRPLTPTLFLALLPDREYPLLITS